jgi:hypothetical protein
VTNETTTLIAFKAIPVQESVDISAAAEAVANHLLANVKGRRVELSDENFAKARDLAKIRKTYKIPAEPRPQGAQLNGSDLDKANIPHLEAIVLGSMAIKGS